MSCPTLTCHHKSGSTANVRPAIKTAPTSMVPSIAGNEMTRFSKENDSAAPVVTTGSVRAAAGTQASEAAGIAFPPVPESLPHVTCNSLIVLFSASVWVGQLRMHQPHGTKTRAACSDCAPGSGAASACTRIAPRPASPAPAGATTQHIDDDPVDDVILADVIDVGDKHLQVPGNLHLRPARGQRIAAICIGTVINWHCN